MFPHVGDAFQPHSGTTVDLQCISEDAEMVASDVLQFPLRTRISLTFLSSRRISRITRVEAYSCACLKQMHERIVVSLKDDPFLLLPKTRL